jgi:hypothetical protein
MLRRAGMYFPVIISHFLSSFSQSFSLVFRFCARRRGHFGGWNAPQFGFGGLVFGLPGGRSSPLCPRANGARASAHETFAAVLDSSFIKNAGLIYVAMGSINDASSIPVIGCQYNTKRNNNNPTEKVKQIPAKSL